MDERKRLTRAEIASAASVIGVTALIVGGLIFLITSTISIPVFACVIVGAVGIGLWMWWAPGELQAWLTGRQTRFGTTSLVITVLFIGLVAYAYVLVDRAKITADLTSIQRYSLKQPSLDTITQLRQRGYRVRIVGFFSHNKLRDQESADLLLRQYANKGKGTVEVQYVDPDEQPDVATNYDYNSSFDGKLFLTVLDANGQPRTKQVLNDQGQAVSKYVTIYLGDTNERDITTGLKTVASAGVFKVYFTIGHGERDLTKIDDTGISRLYVSLEGQGIGVDTLDLAKVSSVPDDASAVLVVGAWQDFTEAEVKVLDDYIKRGGRLGIFADPPIVEAAIIGQPGNTFLQEGGPLNNYLWDEFGIRVRDALVIETQPDLINQDEWSPMIGTIAPHTIMSDVRNKPVYMQYARPLELVQQPDDRQAQYQRLPLFFTSKASFGETDITSFLDQHQISYDPAKDIPGPLLVAATAQRTLESQQTIQPRVIVVGDSDVLKNGYTKQIPGNVFFWSDVVDWLTGFAQAVTFAPVNDPTLFDLSVTASERRTIAGITLIAVPGLILIAGTAMWWYRRR